MSEMFVWQQKEEFTEALSHSLGDKGLRILYVLFFCNRGDTYFSIITVGSTRILGQAPITIVPNS